MHVPWGSDCFSLGLSFHICEVGMMIYLPYRVVPYREDMRSFMLDAH